MPSIFFIVLIIAVIAIVVGTIVAVCLKPKSSSPPTSVQRFAPFNPPSSSSSSSPPPKTSAPEKSIIIALLNNSSTVSQEEFQTVASALQTQIERDFFPEWDIYARLIIVNNMSQVKSNYWLVILQDKADLDEAFGYHTLTSTGMPMGKVFVEMTKQYGIPWSLTMSHELLEMLTDPYADISVFINFGNNEGLIISYENSDPCQSIKHSYTIDNVVVSDFVLPEWFGFYDSADGNYDFKGFLKEPLTLLPGGYALVYPIPNNNGDNWEIVMADRHMDQSKAIKINDRSNIIRYTKKDMKLLVQLVSPRTLSLLNNAKTGLDKTKKKRIEEPPQKSHIIRRPKLAIPPPPYKKNKPKMKKKFHPSPMMKKKKTLTFTKAKCSSCST